jgi:hypothetical protein
MGGTTIPSPRRRAKHTRRAESIHDVGDRGSVTFEALSP